MPRPRASVPPEAIRIEDEVWQEAFTRREAAKRPRLHAIDGGRPLAPPPPVPVPAPGPDRRPARAPRTAAARRPAEPTASTAAARATLERERSTRPVGGVPGRRTVTIRGHGAERNLAWPDGSRRRPQRRAYERTGFRPDRVAMWAVMLGILLVIVALASPHS